MVVIGEEPHLAYNRVGLTGFFEHRKVENLYINPEKWYKDASDGSLNYHLNSRVTEIRPEQRKVLTESGEEVSYNILVLATGSDAILPDDIPGYDAKGVFVYRTVEDLQQLIELASTVKGSTGCVVGGGLLGLEAAKAMLDLEDLGKVKLLERNRWVLSRQLDGDAGTMVVDLIRKLGLEVLLTKRVKEIEVDEDNSVKGVLLEDGERTDCSCVVFAIGVKPRDELARKAGLTCSDRGGITVDDDLKTSDPNIYAIGECSSWEDQSFGLIAPGYEQADVLSFNLTQAKAHSYRKFKRPDLSTKLKLLGVEVASFGDFFADRDGPKYLPRRHKPKGENLTNGNAQTNGNTHTASPSSVKALTFKDPFGAVYKKYIFTSDGKYLLGGMMIGDTKDYVKLVSMVKSQKPLEVPPAEFIVGSQKGGEENADDLDDDTQICSCNNVSKGEISRCIKDGTCKSLGEVKACTKAGTSCSGCLSLVTSILNKTMKEMGQEVSNNLCPHFKHSRGDLFNIINVKQLKSFADVIRSAGKDPESLGCEVCKPTIGSILASLFNKHVLDKPLHGLQDTNDRFLGNIQRNGTFSVIPRIAGGEITPDKLIAIGTVAKKYDLYTKITGGQRIDMFGAKKQDLLDIWTELVAAGLESGHAYAKALRTVKSCVGTTWCRFGIGDAVGMAIRLEERYKSIRSPHKIKGGVSGCVRECAEAQSKDFGLIATEKGYNIYVGGNGGTTPRPAEKLAGDVPPDDVIPILDRYLMLYIKSADRLQRTARWIEQLPGGIKYLREVILDDKLGICAELEKQMQAIVGTFFCEWTATITSPDRRRLFQQFANSTATQPPAIEPVSERGQSRPAYWAKSSALDDFKATPWTSLTWQPIIQASLFPDTPTGSSRPVLRGDTQLAVFKIHNKYYASQQMCPHRRAFGLSDGLIGESDDKSKLYISCPYHKRNYQLNGPAQPGDRSAGPGSCGNDPALNIATFEAEERGDGWVYLKLPSVEELDGVLGTTRWVVRKEESEDPFRGMDEKIGYASKKGLRGPKGGAVQVMGGIDW